MDEDTGNSSPRKSNFPELIERRRHRTGDCRKQGRRGRPEELISRSIIFSCTPQERQTSNKISALFTNKCEQSAKNCRKKPQNTKKFEKRSPSKYHFLYSSGETDTKQVTVRSVSKSITGTASNSNLPFLENSLSCKFLCVDCKCAEARTPTERRNDAHSPRGRKLEENDKTRQTLAIFWTVVSSSCTCRSNELGLRHLQDPRHFGQPDGVQCGALTPTAREGKDELVKWISRHST